MLGSRDDLNFPHMTKRRRLRGCGFITNQLILIRVQPLSTSSLAHPRPASTLAPHPALLDNKSTRGTQIARMRNEDQGRQYTLKSRPPRAKKKATKDFWVRLQQAIDRVDWGKVEVATVVVLRGGFVSRNAAASLVRVHSQRRGGSEFSNDLVRNYWKSSLLNANIDNRFSTCWFGGSIHTPPHPVSYPSQEAAD